MCAVLRRVDGLGEVTLASPSDKPEWVSAYEAKLAEYYKEPVRPISFYCNQFILWRRAILDALERGDFDWDDYTKERWQKVVSALNEVEIPIRKSNLLWRLLYGGEDLRTEQCPIHKGHWSGCKFGGDACPHCMYGYDVTGWVGTANQQLSLGE